MGHGSKLVRSKSVVAVATAIGMLALGGSASASTLIMSGGAYTLKAAAGEVNTMAIGEYDGGTKYLAFEDTAGITVGARAAAAGCAAGTPERVLCEVADVDHAYTVRLNAGDQDDSLVGLGNEDLIGSATLIGGDGDDTIYAFGSTSGVGVSSTAIGGEGTDLLIPNGSNRMQLVTNGDDGNADTVSCTQSLAGTTANVIALVDADDTLRNQADCLRVRVS